AESLYLTHGYTEIFTRHLRESGHDAHVLATEYGGEDGDDGPDTGDAA
ncbi:MAG: DNA ligase-associated DEXH box helicase, partial [Paracoccaceae bacterium]|nr:DNA ligase-associated DEXH box helicase [Paracoccaceae bacterium]